MDFGEYLKKLQNLPDKQKKIILWVVVAVLGIVMGIFWIRGAMNTLSNIGNRMGGIEIPEVDLSDMPKLPDLSVLETADWKTYKNEKVGIEFRYPPKYEISTEEINKECGGLFSINFRSGGKEVGDFSIDAATHNWGCFSPSIIYYGGEGNIEDMCSNQLSYDSLGQACKFINIGEKSKGVLNTHFQFDNYHNGLYTHIVFNNESKSSIYKGFTIDLTLYSYNDEITDPMHKLPPCDETNSNSGDCLNMDGVIIEEPQDCERMTNPNSMGARECSEFLVLSKNIMEKKGLSDEEINEMETIEAILSTLEFSK